MVIWRTSVVFPAPFKPILASMNIKKIHIHWNEMSKRGVSASMKTALAPSQVIHFSAFILNRLRSAMTPIDGLTMATRMVPMTTARDHAASEDISTPMTVPVKPLASRNR